MGRDPALAVQARLYDLHASGEQHEKRNDGAARPEEDFAALDAAALSQRPYAVDLLGRQDRKCLGAWVERAGYMGG